MTTLVGKSLSGFLTHYADPSDTTSSLCGGVQGSLRIEASSSFARCKRCRVAKEEGSKATTSRSTATTNQEDSMTSTAHGNHQMPASESGHFAIGELVESEFGRGTVTASTDRSVTYVLEDGTTINTITGTPGYRRIHAISRNMTPDQVLHALYGHGAGPLGATRQYPQDAYPVRVVKASGTGKIITYCRVRTVDASTGHAPHHFDGPFPVWSHDYTAEELTTFSQMEQGTHQARWSEKRGCYQDNGTPVYVGVATYHRNYSF